METKSNDKKGLGKCEERSEGDRMFVGGQRI